MEILQALLLSDNQDLCHRGVVITLNLMQAERSLAEKLMESEALEILSVLAKATEATKAPVTRAAQHCLDLALEYGLIRSNDGKTSGKSEP